MSKNTTIKYKIATADWNPWPKDRVTRQMCELGATSRYPDPLLPNLQFFKPDSQGYASRGTTKRDLTLEEGRLVAEQRKRWELTDRDIYNSVLYSTPDSAFDPLATNFQFSALLASLLSQP